MGGRPDRLQRRALRPPGCDSSAAAKATTEPWSNFGTEGGVSPAGFHKETDLVTLEDKRFAVLVEDLYEDLELWYPVYRLREAGARVTIVGPQSGTTYKSKHGYPATADKAADQVTADDFDALVIPGGYAPDRMRRHGAMVDLTRQMAQAGKLVAAICHGGWMLCSADVVNDKQVTSFFAIRDDLVHAGAHWVDQEAVQDGWLITSRTPDDLPAFLRTIIAACTANEEAEVAAERSRHAG
jgi:protease I